MATTTNLGMTLVEQSQAQKEVTINQAFTMLDVVAGTNVVDKDLSSPPATPLAGRLYIVGPSPTGAWAGRSNALAYFDQIWRFITPQSGMRMWVQDEGLDYRYSGSSWSVVASGGGGGGSGSVTSVSVTSANGVSGSVTNPTTTPAISLSLGAITPSSVAASGTVTGSNLSGTNTGDQTISLTGEVTGSGTGSFATTLSNAAVISKTLTGYVSGAGTVAATDTVLQAVQKLNGNVALRAPLASPTFTGTVTLPAGQVVNGVTLSTAQGTSAFLRGDGSYAVPSGTGGGIGGPGTSTTTALARWADIVGGSLSNSGILVDASNNITGAGALASGAHTINSAAATALVVGANGATNPALTVDASTASSATGLSVKSAAAAGGLAVAVTSSGANENLTISAKGSGTIALGGTSTGAITLTRATTLSAGATINGGGLTHSGGNFASTNAASSTAANVRFGFTGASDTSLTLSAEAPSVYFNLGQTRQHATGALALQRDYRVTPSTHAFVAASTLTDSYGMYIDGAPIAGTNASITNSATLGLGANAVGAGVTNSYGLIVNPNTGATNNYGAWLKGISIIDNIRGTVTNDSAASGCIGELISASVLIGAAVALTTGVAANVTSITLTPGEWDVSGVIAATFTGGGATVQQLIGWTSTTSATVPNPLYPNGGGVGAHNSLNTIGLGLAVQVGVQQFKLASTTTIYLSCQSTFSGGTSGGFGYIRARRMR